MLSDELKRVAQNSPAGIPRRHLAKALQHELDVTTRALIQTLDDATARRLQGRAQLLLALIEILETD